MKEEKKPKQPYFVSLMERDGFFEFYSGSQRTDLLPKTINTQHRCVARNNIC